jgi:hypothetical protein
MRTAPSYWLTRIPMTMRSIAPLATDDDCLSAQPDQGSLPVRSPGMKMQRTQPRRRMAAASLRFRES